MVGSDAFTGALSRAVGETVAGSTYTITQGSLALSSAVTVIGLAVIAKFAGTNEML
ncbi:MAG: hypothetical protein ACKOIZ_11260 [Actinomycetota bacterium]